MSNNAIDNIQAAIKRLYEIARLEEQARVSLRELAQERRDLRERIIADVDGIVGGSEGETPEPPANTDNAAPTASETFEAPTQYHNGHDEGVEEVEAPAEQPNVADSDTRGWPFPEMPSGLDRRFKKQFQEGAQARAEGEPLNRCCRYKPGTKSHDAASAGWRAMDAQMEPEPDGPVEESAEEPVDAHQEPTPAVAEESAQGEGYDMVDVGDPDPEQMPWPGEQSAGELNTGSMKDNEWSEVDPLDDA